MTNASMPRIGVWVSTQAFARASFEDITAFLGGLEASGYRMLWIPESFGREVMALSALLLSHSDRLMIGTGIANIWARDPVAMENGAKTLAEAYPGRFVLGIGISHRPNVAGRGQHYDRPLERTRQYLEAMDSARYDAAEPPARALRVLAALGPRMLELAADLADGAHPYLVTPAHTAEARAILGTAALLAPEQSVVLESDPATARARGRTHLAHYLDRSNYRRSFLRQGFSLEDVDGEASDRLVDAIVAHGDEHVIRERIGAHLEAGADHVAVQAVEPNLDRTLATFQAMAPVLGALERPA